MRLKASAGQAVWEPLRTYLERQPRLDLVCKHVGDSLVEVCEDLHGQLWLDATLGDQVVQGVGESTAQAVYRQPACSKPQSNMRMQYLLRR